LVAGSTSELATVLDAARKQFPLHLMLPVFTAALFALAIGYGLQPLALGVFVCGLISWPVMFALDRRRRTTTLEYKLDDSQNEKFTALIHAFNGVASCRGLWRVPQEWDQQDWKRNAGAAVTIARQAIGARIGLPSLIKSNLSFPSFPLGKETIYFTPDAVLIVARNSVAALRYGDCDISASTTRFIESDGAPTDARVVDETWQYVNRNGGPDRRFSNNRRLPICVYGQIELKSKSGLNEQIHCSRPEVASDFAMRVVALRNTNNEPTTKTEPTARRANNETISETAASFAGESERARTLALEHGKFWKFLLVQELLTSKVAALKKECSALREAVDPSVPTRHLTGLEFADWVGAEMDGLSTSMSAMSAILKNDIPNALGKPDSADDATDILKIVKSLFDACDPFISFERDLRLADPPKGLKPLSDAFRGITLSIAEDLQRASEDWARAVDGLQNGSHNFQVNITFNSFPQLTTASIELEKIRKNPAKYL
jgi:hypothetical protein